MKLIILSFFVLLSSLLEGQNDTIFTIHQQVINCTITHTTSSVYFYSQKDQIRSINSDQIKMVSFNGKRGFYSDTVSIKDEIIFLKKSINSYARQKEMSIGLMLGGTMICASGVMVGANVNKFGYTLVPIGAIISLVGLAANVDSYKYLKRAGFGIKGNSVIYTIR